MAIIVHAHGPCLSFSLMHDCIDCLLLLSLFAFASSFIALQADKYNSAAHVVSVPQNAVIMLPVVVERI